MLLFIYLVIVSLHIYQKYFFSFVVCLFRSFILKKSYTDYLNQCNWKWTNVNHNILKCIRCILHITGTFCLKVDKYWEILKLNHWHLTFIIIVFSGDFVQPSEASREGSHPDVSDEVYQVSEARGFYCGLHWTNGEHTGVSFSINMKWGKKAVENHNKDDWNGLQGGWGIVMHRQSVPYMGNNFEVAVLGLFFFIMEKKKHFLKL